MDEASWLIETAKQVPALAVLTSMVVYFIKHLGILAEEFEKRMAAVTCETEDRLERVLTQQNETIKALTVVLQANNELIGSIKTLLILVEGDLKNGRRQP